MDTKRRGIRSGIFLFMAFMVLISSVNFAFAEESSGGAPTSLTTSSSVPKAIYLVYDDSGSMLRDNSNNYYDRWCQAKYAMQSFAAMLNIGDRMSIYTMSGIPQRLDLTNDGSNLQEIVNKVDTDINSMSLYTDFTPVTKAYNELSNLPPEYEKWLVVLTDGTFNKGEGKDNVEGTLLQYADGLKNKNGKVIYMAISNEAKEFASQPDKGFYAFAAKDSSQVLSKVTEMGNLVFNREQLPSDCYSYDSAKGVLTLNLPMSMDKVTVFGQGGNISLGEIKNESDQWQKNSEINLKYSELIPDGVAEYPIDKSLVVTDKTLMGTIANYGVAGEGTTFIPKGEYSLSVENAQEINVYYVYDFDIITRLTYNGVEINEGESLSSGEYSYKIDIVDPATGESIDTGLIKSLSYNISIKNDENTQVLTDPEGIIELKKGPIEIISTVVADNSITRTNSLSGYIYGATEFSVEGIDKVIPIKTLENEENRVAFSMTIDGTPLTDEQFASATLEAMSDNKIRYEVVKDNESKKFFIYPKYYEEGKYYTTDTGTVNMKLKCSYIDNGEKLTFSDGKELQIEDAPFWEKLLDFVGRNWWWLLLLLLLLILLFLYSPFVKKRLPRGLSPCFIAHEYREPERIVSANTKVLNKFLPVVPDKMTIKSGSADVDGVFFPEIILEATGKWNKRKASIINTESIMSSSAYEENMLDYGGTNFLDDYNGRRIPISLDDTITLTEKRATNKSSRIELKFKKIERSDEDYY